jgi:3D (Asp-Asp-Asp) domain-containing protein
MGFQLYQTKNQLVEINSDSNEIISRLQEEKEFRVNLLNSIFNEEVTKENKKTIVVDITAYSASVDETDNSPHITADGTLSTVGRVAVSRDLLKKGITYGSRIYIPNQGVFIVADTMNKRFSNRVDLLLANKKAAKLFGVKENVKIYYFRS